MNEAGGRPLGPQQIQDSHGVGEDGDGGEAAGPGFTWPQLTVWSWWFWLSAARILGFLPLGFVDQLPRASVTWTRYSAALCAGLTVVRALAIVLFLLGPFQPAGNVFMTVFAGVVLLKAAVITVVSAACLRESATMCAVVAALRHCVALQPLRRSESWARLAAVSATFFMFLVLLPAIGYTGANDIESTFSLVTDFCDGQTTVLLALLDAVFCNEVAVLWVLCSELRLDVAVLWVLCTELRLDVFGLLSATAPSPPRTRGVPKGPTGPGPASPSSGSDTPLSWLSLWSVAPDSDSDNGVAKEEAKVKAIRSSAKAGAVCSPAKVEAAFPGGLSQSSTLHAWPGSGSAASWRQMRLRLLRVQDIRTALCSAYGWPNLLSITMSLVNGAVAIFEDLASLDHPALEANLCYATMFGLGVVGMFVLVCSVCQQVQNEHDALEHLLSGFLARLPDMPLDVKDEVRGFVAQIQLHGGGFTALDIISINTTTMASVSIGLASNFYPLNEEHPDTVACSRWCAVAGDWDDQWRQ
ncbi:Meiosis regulator and mRNA stability factor 1 [Frankliniella fusca]|uniref:Gustatory receptor n=1 Tax=Frankliniella fusca TaxID=407009 RepID=A0AAE1GN81_9NEOP|nr:Meiosis regulator and mRNA stability factor 1 [Frankliniella fusca]